MKIFFLTLLLSPYRTEWLNQLSVGNEVQAYYLYDEEATREQAWLNSHRPLFKTAKAETDRLFHRFASGSFLRTVRQSDADIFLIDGYSTPLERKVVYTLLKLKKRVYINIDGIDVWRQRSAADILKDRVKRRLFRSGAHFLCGSRIAAQVVIDGGCDPDRVHVHPFTSLHEDDMIAAEDKPSLQLEYKEKLSIGDHKLALAVGRFIPLKKYDVLIQAWRDMPDDCVLYLIGGGEERPRYEELINQYGTKNIILIDFLMPEKLSEYFCAADIFVHPSSTETWGLVINEAMAKGCPVIATDRCVAAVELIRDGGEGYIVPVGDADILRERMLRLLNDDSLRSEASKNAVRRIKPYTYENLAAEHLRIFKEE